MTKLQKSLGATLLTLSIATVSFGGTITGSRTAKIGTITGSRTGTITGSRTGTITGSRIGQGIIPTQSERGSKSTQEESFFSSLLILLSSLVW